MAEAGQLLLRLLPAIPLYIFLGVLLIALWREGRSRGVSGDQAPPAYLRQESEGEGGFVRLGEMNLLGRAADNTVRLTDRAVSAYHARLSFQAGQWWLEDLGSRNGTTVNRLRLEGPLVVTYGDVIQLGGTAFTLAPGQPPVPPPTA
jgi:pSer/pThr/pTyr-binding forkhead associated (FHA) protein